MGSVYAVNMLHIITMNICGLDNFDPQLSVA